MKRCSRILYIIIGLVLLLVACKSQPDYVIEEDRMVDILVDIHKTEAVINLNYSQFPTDEKKRIVREAVYMRHNTTKADFDTSLVWYGNHLDVYMNVYDRVIEKLKKEDAELKELIDKSKATNAANTQSAGASSANPDKKKRKRIGKEKVDIGLS